MFDIGPFKLLKIAVGEVGERACVRWRGVKEASSVYDPVTSLTRLKKARLRSVLMPQFTGTV